MEGMSEINRKKNTGEPTNNGGEFGTRTRDEADTALSPEPTMVAFSEARTAVGEAQTRLWLAAEDAIPAIATSEEDEVRHALFSWYSSSDGASLVFIGLLDAEGGFLNVTDERKSQLGEIAGTFTSFPWVQSSSRFAEDEDEMYIEYVCESPYLFDVRSLQNAR